MLSELPAPIGQSRPFQELLERVSRLAPLDRPILVVGERGTGKELIAERLHFLSRRWDAPLIKLNCAALPESLVEAELFGHEAGAFTGAQRRRPGRFELADGGSLFLDEIASASAAVQEKILRVIEYGELERLGGQQTLAVDVRVIAATNVDLPAAAKSGRFRHDLIDRLAFDVLTLPPLRARPEDLPLLAEHFGRAMAHDLGWPAFPGFAGPALTRLGAHDWPGNVRELRNVVERSLAAGAPGRAVEEILLDPFESPFRPAAEARQGPAPGAAPGEPSSRAEIDARTPFDLRGTVAAFERGLLHDALAANRHNQRATARHLGVSYHQLRNTLKKHGLLARPAD